MLIDRLNLRHLRAAIAVGHYGSISAAARAVNLTQPALTQGLAKLEDAVGAVLFTRRREGMVTTDAAAVLLPRLAAATALIDNHRITAAQVRAFLAVAKAGGYVPAAAMIGISGASLHRAVGDLTLAVGYPIVARSGGGVALTARGRQLVRRLTLARAEIAAGLDEVAAVQGHETGSIVVGAMPLSRARLLPAAIAAFHARHPGFAIAVVEGSHAELVGPLQGGEIDIMIGALRPMPGADLAQDPLFDDRPLVVARSGHPLVGIEAPLVRLAAFPWVMPARGAPLRDLMDRMFAAADLIPPAVPIRCGSVLTTRQLLLAGDFLTLLSPDQVAVELAAGWLAIVHRPPPTIVRTIGVSTRAAWMPTPLQRAFVAQLKAEAAIS